MSSRLTMLRRAHAFGSPDPSPEPSSEPSPEPSAPPTESRHGVDRPWSLSDMPLGAGETKLGWSTRLKVMDYRAAGVVPFAYKEDEGELYVLLSIQEPNKKGMTGPVYTFLGGKVDPVDRMDARRTAAREVHEETHRLLCEADVLEALSGTSQACSMACGCSPPPRAEPAGPGPQQGPRPASEPGVSAAADNDDGDDAEAEARAAAERSASSRGAGPGPGSAKVAASAQAKHRTGQVEDGGRNDGGSVSAAAAAAGSTPALGPGAAPHAHFPSGRYIAFAVHLPGAWQLPDECDAKIKAAVWPVS
ncbi:hypothetical protein GPECTOR_5g251 [Gonium pectorale]|uniref:Uncharacterized protein n=1 Tax=Gonium pectorale TaxID=33097 RepID=A0A150GWK7_GONPE|nr:hypothetical protein GPECTOR_5g251 [Gonium pectorale]|eukprot:KXZ54153.1 hypothetical protein GPECTOR_5g251 [Gonium pectorale]